MRLSHNFFQENFWGNFFKVGVMKQLVSDQTSPQVVPIAMCSWKLLVLTQIYSSPAGLGFDCGALTLLSPVEEDGKGKEEHRWRC